jgi:WD40 repeat protein
MSQMLSRSVALLAALLALLQSAGARAQQEQTLKGHTGWIAALAFSPDGKTLASGSGDHTVNLWDAATGQVKHTLKGHTDYVAAVAFSKDGALLATGSFDGTAKIWDAAKQQEKFTLRGHRGVVMAVAFSADGKTLATGGMDATIRLWDVASGKQKELLSGHLSWVNALAYSPDGKHLASASSDGTVKLWQSGSQKPQASHEALSPEGRPLGEARSLAFSPDGGALAVGVRYGYMQVLDGQTLKLKHTFKGHVSDVWSVAFSPDGKTLVSGNGDWDKPGDVKLWDTAGWKETTLKHTGEVLAVAVSKDGVIAAGSWDKTVKIWPPKSKQ